MKKLEFRGGEMWVSSGLGASKKICTRARTISFRMSYHFSKSVKSTTSYMRGTENIPKTRKMKKKTRVSRGEMWVSIGVGA